MTLGDMETAIAGDLMETPDTRAGGDPFGLRRQIARAANEIAQASDCLFGSRTTGLTANQGDYCVSDVYRIKAVTLIDDKGAAYSPVQITDIRDANRLLGSNWQNATAETNPQTAIFYGANRVVLSAKPLFARAGALTIYGFCKPGEFWAYTSDGTPIALDAAHECPLPVWAHEAVVAQAEYLRAMTDDRAEIQNRVPALTNRAQMLLATVRRDAALHHARLG